MADTHISWLAAEAALCLWEEIATNEAGPWKIWRDQHGSWDTRQAILRHAQACTDDWHALNPMEDGALAAIDMFDWEFCPLWLRVAIDWDVPAGQLPRLLEANERHAAIRAAAPKQEAVID
jgi:hypothetical protein